MIEEVRYNSLRGTPDFESRFADNAFFGGNINNSRINF